jgi:adenylate kinase family enzyme
MGDREMERIAIVGTSASGKTTLAKALSRALRIPHIELDALNWLPDWKERRHEDFLEGCRAASATSGNVPDSAITVLSDEARPSGRDCPQNTQDDYR